MKKYLIFLAFFVSTACYAYTDMMLEGSEESYVFKLTDNQTSVVLYPDEICVYFIPDKTDKMEVKCLPRKKNDSE